MVYKTMAGFCQPFMSTSAARDLQVVKVCGVVTANDAKLVATMCREILPVHTELLVGMILWPRSRRSVTPDVARSIADMTLRLGAKPVAVFVDETVEEMQRICSHCNIDVAQLHGKRSRANVANNGGSFDSGLVWIDVKDVMPNGVVSNAEMVELPSHSPGRFWTLYDAKGGGTGKSFDWHAFSAPTDPWLLAGGLGPDNVHTAVTSLRPSGLDVASGVAKEDLCHKDPSKLRQFLERTVDAYS